MNRGNGKSFAQTDESLFLEIESKVLFGNPEVLALDSLPSTKTPRSWF